MGTKIYPAIVSLLGGVGLGLALTYFIGVYLAFQPGWEEWSEFFVQWALLLLLPPYVLLIFHLFLRNHVGRYLLNRGAYSEALDYGRRRTKASVLRSRREVANQRLVWAQGLVALGRYDEAEELLKGRLKTLPGSYQMEARRWLMEIALRKDDRQAAEDLVLSREDVAQKKGRHLAALMACEAELALRRGELSRYRDRMMEAIWKEAAHPRVGLSRALARVEYDEERTSEETDEEDNLLRDMELVEEPVGREIPPRRSEIRALRAKVLWQRGGHDEARELLKEAAQGPTDAWTSKIIGEVQNLVVEE